MTDLRDLLDQTTAEVLNSKDIVAYLTALEHRPWATYRGGQPITERRLAVLLRPVMAHPDRHDVDGKRKRGYQRAPIEAAMRGDNV